MSKLEAQAQLELGAQYWWVYSPFATGEGGLFFSLLALPGCQLPLYSLMLTVGSLCLLRSLIDVITGDLTLSHSLLLGVSTSICSIWLNLYPVAINFVFNFFPQVARFPYTATM